MGNTADSRCATHQEVQDVKVFIVVASLISESVHSSQRSHDAPVLRHALARQHASCGRRCFVSRNKAVVIVVLELDLTEAFGVVDGEGRHRPRLGVSGPIGRHVDLHVLLSQLACRSTRTAKAPARRVSVKLSRLAAAGVGSRAKKDVAARGIATSSRSLRFSAPRRLISSVSPGPVPGDAGLDMRLGYPSAHALSTHA